MGRRKESVGEEAEPPDGVTVECSGRAEPLVGLHVQSSLDCFSSDLSPCHLGSCDIRSAADFPTTSESQSGLAKFGPVLSLGLRRLTFKKANLQSSTFSINYLLVEKVHFISQNYRCSLIFFLRLQNLIFLKPFKLPLVLV